MLECSIEVVIIRLPRLFCAFAAPKTAILLLSVPPEVKYISLDSQESAFAIFLLESSISSDAALSFSWSDEGLLHQVFSA